MRIVQRLYAVCFNIICLLSFCFIGCFSITASAYTPVNADIAVEGVRISESNSHMYEIVIESLDSNAPVPESDRLFITDSGSGVFTIKITEPGTYVYKIYEKHGSDLSIVYDDTIYYVTVFVTNAEEKSLTYAVSVKTENHNYKADCVVFKDVSSGNTTISTTGITSVTTVTEITTAVVTTTDSLGDKKLTELIESVLTGDNTPIGLVLIIMMISAIMGLIMIMMKKDNERRQ